MPELPEVETIKLGLKKFLFEHKIQNVDIRDSKIFSSDKNAVIGAKIKDVRRFAKVIVIDLSNGKSIVIHVKLTGQIVYRGPNLKSPGPLSKKIAGLGERQTHVIFMLDKDGRLYYNDARRFGWIKIVRTNEVDDFSFIKKLGPEPFKDLTLQKFEEILSKNKRAIKVTMMDQEKIGGIGNIYANESLWKSKIHPQTPANSISEKQTKLLYDCLLEVLKDGMKYGGSSELAYVRADGTDGEYQRHFLAYNQQDKVCQRCKKEKMVKTFLRGRGTYFCPHCQKL